MPEIGLNELLQAGVHFGHQTRRWNPKMRQYIFAERNGIHIIDLRKTLDRLLIAQQAVREVVLRGERILFVCTKRQLRSIVEVEAQRSGSFYVTERWLGGMLTNFQTIRKQIRRLKELERGVEEGAFEFYTKKERLMLERERIKLDKYLVGVKDMGRLPGAMFVVDARRETIAIREAKKLGIPVIAITDTNADPDPIDFPIPGNDDAIRAVTLIAAAIADSVEGARKEVPDDERRRSDQVEATMYSTETGETVEKEKPQRRRPRRKRRPRPEVLADHAKGAEGAVAEEAEAKQDDSPAEEAPAAEAAKEAPAAEAEAPAAEAAKEAPAAEADAPAAEAEAPVAKKKAPAAKKKAPAAKKKAPAAKAEAPAAEAEAAADDAPSEDKAEDKAEGSEG